MQERGWSQAEVGRRLRTPQKPNGISGVAVGHWLHGDARPTQISAEVIADALQLRAEEVRDALGLEAAASGGPPYDTGSQRRLIDVVGRISQSDLEELCDFADFLAARREREEWRQFALDKLARAYGDSEPEYTLADLKS